MEHELKIITKGATSSVQIFLDGEKLGYIQDIKLHASVNNIIPTISITYPSSHLILKEQEKLNSQIEILQTFLHVKIERE